MSLKKYILFFQPSEEVTFNLRIFRGTLLVVQLLRLCLPMQGLSSISSQGAKIPNALRQKNKNIKQKQNYSKFNKDFKNHPH